MRITFVLIIFLSGCALIVGGREKNVQKLHEESIQSKCFFENVPLVLLGGGMASKNTLNTISKARVRGALEFIKKYRSLLSNTLVMSGGPVEGKDGLTEAYLMKKMFRELAVGEKFTESIEIIEEAKSLSTMENATHTKDLFVEKKWDLKLVLMTDLFHLERAKQNFETAGFEICPALVVDRKFFRDAYLNSPSSN